MTNVEMPADASCHKKVAFFDGTEVI
jgi:hypothetical protein